MGQGAHVSKPQQHDTDALPSRRRFLKLAAAGTAVAAVAGAGLISRPARADNLTPLSEADPLARSLHYADDARRTDNDQHQKGEHCANCQFYTGQQNAGRGSCQLFPGKSVNTDGWCASFQARS